MLKVYLLLFIAACALPGADVTVTAARLQDQIRGGLLGHIIGDLNGLKHEMKYIAEPGKVESYVPSLPEGGWTDDDTDVEWVYLLEMERSKTLLVPPARIAELWKRHINRRIWCSHLYLRQLIDLGIEPPLTGSVALNPWAGFNLSGQFVSESFALISPGMPRTAARIGTHYTRVAVEGEPIQATQLFTTMIATAYLTSDMEKILDAGLAALDPGSKMHQVVVDVRAWHKKYPKEWETTRRLTKEKYMWFGGQDVRDRNGVILNGASTIAALLYGKGDFAETARHAFNLGWDADNNAATACTIIGVIKGGKWMLSQGWDIKDVFRNTSRDNMPMDETITKFGNRLIALAGQVIVEHGGSKVTLKGEPAWRIRTEAPALLEKLAAAKPKIQTVLAPGASQQELAREAYLAICLDQAEDMRRKDPEGWTKALAALSTYPKVLQVIFYQSGPAGAEIRKKALAAGLTRPATAAKPE